MCSPSASSIVNSRSPGKLPVLYSLAHPTRAHDRRMSIIITSAPHKLQTRAAWASDLGRNGIAPQGAKLKLPTAPIGVLSAQEVGTISTRINNDAAVNRTVLPLRTSTSDLITAAHIWLFARSSTPQAPFLLCTVLALSDTLQSANPSERTPQSPPCPI